MSFTRHAKAGGPPKRAPLRMASLLSVANHLTDGGLLSRERVATSVITLEPSADNFNRGLLSGRSNTTPGAGFEPATSEVATLRSIRLSYPGVPRDGAPDRSRRRGRPVRSVLA